MWGEDLVSLDVKPGDTLLVAGARTSNKYGVIQLNVNSKDGKVTLNPKGYKKVLEQLKKPSITLITQLTEEQKQEASLKQLTGHITSLIGDLKDVTYLGCPTCFSKLKEAFCERCKAKVPTGERFFFFRANFEDCTGVI